ncbi:MAG: hypothetical protein J6N72_01780, partial [Psychrobacter sp.]|nr:hypothetical protein [Psychrobacter sp.]
MLTGASGLIMRQVLGVKIVGTISTIIAETREIIRLAEATGGNMDDLRGAITKIKESFMVTTTTMTNVKKKSSALSKLVYDLECFIEAASNAVDDHGDFIISDYRGMREADIQIKKRDPNADGRVFDANKNVDAIVYTINTLIELIKDSIKDASSDDVFLLFADMKLVSDTIEKYSIIIADGTFNDIKEPPFDSKDALFDVKDILYNVEDLGIDNKEVVIDAIDDVNVCDSDEKLILIKQKSNLRNFMWAVKLASDQDGQFYISRYQGMKHASSRAPLIIKMPKCDINEDDEVRDLVRSYLAVLYHARNRVADNDDCPISNKKSYIGDYELALSSCRVLIEDRAKANNKRYGDIYTDIRADRPTDRLDVNGVEINHSIKEDMDYDVSGDPLEPSDFEIDLFYDHGYAWFNESDETHQIRTTKQTSNGVEIVSLTSELRRLLNLKDQTGKPNDF